MQNRLSLTVSPNATFRIYLFGRKRLSNDHYDATFPWETEKAKAAAEVGDPPIDKIKGTTSHAMMEI